MDTVIGLGNCGCAIATQLANFPEYKNIIRIDSTEQDSPKENCIDIFLPRQAKPEDYESKTTGLKKHLKKVKGNVLFITAGGGSISLASLAILENIKDKSNITILYVKPDTEFMGADARLKEKLVYNVFQEYTRSGLFDRLYLVSNIMVEKAMGGVSVISYYEKLNDTIVSTFRTMEKLQKSKPVASTFSELPIGTRISTFGLVDIENNNEKMFYSLDSLTDSVYYLAYNETALMEDTKLLNRIKTLIRSKMESGVSRVSYGIYATSYTSTFVVRVDNSSVIQP